jgi:hypothetical protein
MTSSQVKGKTKDAARAEMRELNIESSIRRLLDDAQAVVGSTALLEGTTPPASERYEQEVVRILSRMEIDLRLARAAFDADEAETSEDLRETLRDAGGEVRQWLDEVAVRLHLTGREADDRVREIEHRLDRARGEVLRAGSRIDDAVGSDLESMRTVSLDAIRQVRDAITDCVDGIWHFVP